MDDQKAPSVDLSTLCIAHLVISDCEDYEGNFSLATTLWGVLTNLEKKFGRKWTTWYGTTAPEVNKIFELHINVPGYMQPVLDLEGTQQSCSNNEDLKRQTLADFGVTRSSSVLLLSHKYCPPKVDEQKAQGAISDFHRRFEQVQRQQQAMESDGGQTKTSTEDEDSEDEVEPPQKEEPVDRQLKIWRGRPGRLLPPKVEEEPSDFFDITLEDSKVYSQSLLNRNKDGYKLTTKDRSSKSAKDFQLTRIRIRLPRDIYIEATFKATERVKHVREFVRGVIDSSLGSFYLFVTPPRQVLDLPEKSMTDLRFVPSALIHFALTEPSSLSNATHDDAAHGLVREELLGTVVAPS